MAKGRDPDPMTEADGEKGCGRPTCTVDELTSFLLGIRPREIPYHTYGEKTKGWVRGFALKTGSYIGPIRGDSNAFHPEGERDRLIYLRKFVAAALELEDGEELPEQLLETVGPRLKAAMFAEVFKLSNDEEWAHWYDMDVWTVTEAACLCNEVDPKWYSYLREEPGARIEDEIDLAQTAVDVGALAVQYDEAQGASEAAVLPLDYLDWRAKKRSLYPLPSRLAQFHESKREERNRLAGPNPKMQANALRREMLLGSAVWCIHNHYEECCHNGKVAAKRIVVQISAHYRTMWHVGGFQEMHPQWAGKLLSRWLSQGRIDKVEDEP